MKIRFVIQTVTVTEHPCEYAECQNTQPHTHKTYKYKEALPDGTPVELQVGDVYFGENHLDRYACEWSNCDGRHLCCLVPDGHRYHIWNIDGRARNCTMKDDRLHRCWVRHGDPSIPGQLHVDKAGLTCAAGAGSILTSTWHGFLHHGELK